jgi:hypothetical protein
MWLHQGSQEVRKGFMSHHDCSDKNCINIPLHGLANVRCNLQQSKPKGMLVNP